VLELGMNHPGEIWRLAEIADPDVAVITNVGPAHLEGLGTIANVAAAKEELALAMRASGTLVVPAGDPWLEPVAERFPGRKIRVGEGGEIRATGLQPASSGQRFDLEIDGQRIPLALPCVGAHNVGNALLAAAVGHALGLDARTIATGLERFVPPPMRLEVLELPGGARIWNDAYNANPASTAAALAALAAEPAARRIAVLGEMWELGAAAPEYHAAAGRAAAGAGVDFLLAVGRFAEETASAAVAAGLPAARVRTAESAEAAGRELQDDLRPGDLVLVKGSRGARMEDVVQRLRARS
jgi:UDP-N-acetylmuramoyl-tripeptide--D-alanyl-D-alanine ligase